MKGVTVPEKILEGKVHELRANDEELMEAFGLIQLALKELFTTDALSKETRQAYLRCNDYSIEIFPHPKLPISAMRLVGHDSDGNEKVSFKVLFDIEEYRKFCEMEYSGKVVGAEPHPKI